MGNEVILEWRESEEALQEIFNSAQAIRTRDTDTSVTIKGDKVQAVVPLLEDFTLDIKSSFKSASSVIQEFGGGIAALVQKMQTLQNVFGGTVSQSQNIWELQIWDKTQPIRLDFEVLFYTKTNPLADVLAPILSLLNLTVLSRIKGDGSVTYRVPGVHAKNLTTLKLDATAEELESSTKDGAGLDPTQAKIINLRIPGVITLKDCILETAKPTFSKEKTKSTIPLWGKLQMGIQTVWPASDDMLISEFKRAKKRIKKPAT